MIRLDIDSSIATISLNDPLRRNALSLAMFDGLDGAIARIGADEGVRSVVLRGEGKAFCAGFDLSACVDEPPMMASFIHRLSGLNRSLRRLRQPVIAAVHGAALAGGCAILSACDFILIERTAKLGYPVHRIGISPAVTLPTLTQAIGHGPARALVLSGEIIDGTEAVRIGLATEVVDGIGQLNTRARQLAESLAAKPPGALAATKRWLNELDGSMDETMFDKTAAASAAVAVSAESIEMLRAAWADRS